MKELRPVYQVAENGFGRVRLKIREYLDAHDVPRNRLSSLTGLQYNVINRYYSKGEAVQRLDFEVIAKICFVLDCDLSDILEYEKPSQS